MVTSINKQMIIPEELCEAPFPEANDERFGLPLLISDGGEKAAGENLSGGEGRLHKGSRLRSEPRLGRWWRGISLCPPRRVGAGLSARL